MFYICQDSDEKGKKSDFPSPLTEAGFSTKKRGFLTFNDRIN